MPCLYTRRTRTASSIADATINRIKFLTILRNVLNDGWDRGGQAVLINILSVSQVNDIHHEGVVKNIVDDAMVSHPDAVTVPTV
jgi:hypothetical protein